MSTSPLNGVTPGVSSAVAQPMGYQPSAIPARGPGEVTSGEAPPTGAAPLPETAVRATNRDAALAERTRREGDNSSGSKKLSEDEMRDAAEELQGYMESVRRDLRFNIDDDAGRLVIKVVDQKNGEVVRQIPSEEVLALLRRMKEADGDDRRGMLIKDEA